MKEKFCAILMNKYIVSTKIIIYVPDMLIEGEFCADCFIDEAGKEYLRAEDIENIYDSIDKPVTFAISMSELIEKYNGDKKKYFESYSDKSYIGINLVESESIKIIDSDFEELFNKYNNVLEDEKIFESDNCYFNNTSFDANYIKELLECKTLEEIRVKLLQLSCFYDNSYNDDNNAKVDNNKSKHIDVRDMKHFFDDRIIGLEEAKQAVISNIVTNRLIDDCINKSTCLIIGDTGTGKTMLCDVASKYLDIPMFIVDMANISASGYEGESITKSLEGLLRICDGDIEKAQMGIIVLDEIDKKGSNSNSDIEGKAVLNSLLAFIQGNTYTIKYKYQSYNFDTSRLTFFATGAFTNVIDKLIEKRRFDSNKIGFNINTRSLEEVDSDLYLDVSSNDLVKYGLMPRELMSRITDIIILPKHTKESLRSILTDSVYSVLESERNKFAVLNVLFDYTDEYLDTVADEAYKIGEGARSLARIVNKSIVKARWEVLINPCKYSRVLLTKESVYDNSIFILYDIENREYNFGNNDSKKLIK